ncbi:MAG: P-loop NTPase family protein [Symploca sp. SIO2B6]|nr:P-loop NTPase family protein [Symploca sp. SIO2B6]
MVSQLSRIDNLISPVSKRHFPKLVQGVMQVFSCPHRHFFANMMAQALQAAGQGTSVLVVQFLKGGINQGPDHPTQLAQNLTWLRCDVPHSILTSELDVGERAALATLWQHVQTVVAEGQYSLVILDELSLATHLGLIPLAEVLSFLNQRPSYVDVTLSGTEMPQCLIDMADQVTELRRSHRT